MSTATKSQSTPAAVPATAACIPFGSGQQAPAMIPTSREVGAKGVGLLAMSAGGAPVPAGFILTSALSVDRAYGDGTSTVLPSAAQEALKSGLEALAKVTSTRFGDPAKPLLVVLRSSPPEPMPLSQKAVFNLGLTEASLPAYAKVLGGGESGLRRAWDAYRRLLLSYGEHVLGIDPERFELLRAETVEQAKVDGEHELDLKTLEGLTRAFQAEIEKDRGALPKDPMEWLNRAAAGGFAAWHRFEAEEHRRHLQKEDLQGTALIVQAMVHGTGEGAGCGVGRLHTRTPSTGEKQLYGTFLTDADGGDLTAGVRLPDPVSSLAKRLPQVHADLAGWGTQLEKELRDALELDFIVNDGKLHLLNAMRATRTPRASLKIALDLVDEGICTQQEALLTIDPRVIDEYLHPILDKSGTKGPLTKGLGASPGSAVGQVVFFAEHAVELAAQGVHTILVRHETSPEDIDGLKVAQGILTGHGGLTSHAAVVGRGMGKCVIVGAGALHINYLINEMTVGDVTVKRLDWISLDGTTGEVYVGKLPQVQPQLEGGVARALEWADAARTIGVHANADTPADARHAVELGAEGIGLCRTEHMFFDIDRIPLFRKMILAGDEIGRSAALSELLPLQRRDFLEIFRVMQGRPVTIRLLDPPLNEFLPKGIRSQTRMAKAMKIPVEVIQQRMEALTENNPMMGHRGCRLAITYPEIYNMQVRAIVEAACIVKKEGTPVHPEIMVPLISSERELIVLRKEIETLMARVMGELGENIPFKIGTMIETPRAAVCSRSIARFADFYSFGTNDLTQMGYGFSRDDVGVFLPVYLERGLLENDPFMSFDQEGIGGLVRQAVDSGRRANPALKIGICGEHGGDPHSVEFFHRVGLDYVSCSPFRVPVARMAAGQAALQWQRGELLGAGLPPSRTAQVAHA
jgi:pyruvate, orthophosphate dikinase